MYEQGLRTRLLHIREDREHSHCILCVLGRMDNTPTEEEEEKNTANAYWEFGEHS